ncbi:MAG: hypothetical protein COB99_08095, partial [Sulfurimonas sp.]
MGKIIKGNSKDSLLEDFYDFTKNVKDFAKRLEEKIEEGINSGENEMQALITAGVDSTVYMVVKKYGEVIQIATFKDKDALSKEYGSPISDEIIDMSADIVGSEIGNYADDIYKKHFLDETKQDRNESENLPKQPNKLTLDGDKLTLDYIDKTSRVQGLTDGEFADTRYDEAGNAQLVTNGVHNIKIVDSELSPIEQIKMYLDESGLSKKVSIDDVLAANSITDPSQLTGGMVITSPQSIEKIVNGDETIKVYTGHDGSETYLVTEDGKLVAYRLEYGNGGVLGEDKHVISVLKTNPDGTRELTYEASDGTFKTISQDVENKTFKPLTTIDPETNTATLHSGGTISEVASHTDYTSAELLEYNGISLEDARNLPEGTEIKIPEKVDTLQGEYGN